MADALGGPQYDTECFYGYNVLPLWEFFAGLEGIEPAGSFLDLGSGLGTKLFLARMLGWERIVGVEHDPRLVQLARSLVPEAEIHQADASTWDCSGYDLIYTFRLCLSLTVQDELGDHIAGTADPGTLVFYCGADFNYGERINDWVWRL